MDFIIGPRDVLEGTVISPPSKSYTIRAVLSALLADGESIIRSPLLSRDTQAAFDASRAFGATVELGEEHARIVGIRGKIRTPQKTIDTFNSGTTIRICTGIASLAEEDITLTGDESVRRRPIEPLLDGLSQLGVTSSSAGGCPPVTVNGPLMGGKASMVGDISSQFITSILMSAPYADEAVELKLETELLSKPYVDLTLDILDTFSIDVINRNYESFYVPSGQIYSAKDYTVEGDYSSAAFLLGAAALVGGNVTVKNLFPRSKQADKALVGILERMGADIIWGDDSVTVSSEGGLSGIRVDLSDSPDLVPIVAAMGAACDGELEIVNTTHARIKECDRIHAMATELKKMGAKVEERDDGLLIEGGRLTGAKVDGWKDHRIIMAMSVAALAAGGDTTVAGAEHIDVTFPDFKSVMESLGAGIKVI